MRGGSPTLLTQLCHNGSTWLHVQGANHDQKLLVEDPSTLTSNCAIVQTSPGARMEKAQKLQSAVHYARGLKTPHPQHERRREYNIPYPAEHPFPKTTAKRCSHQGDSGAVLLEKHVHNYDKRPLPSVVHVCWLKCFGQHDMSSGFCF